MRAIDGAAAGVLVLVLAAGCSGGSGAGKGSGGMLDSTDVVCTEFAQHAKAGMPREDRAKVVKSISEVIDNADQRVQDAFPGLRRTAASSDAAYQLAADVFAQSCFDAGWKG